MTEFRLFHLGIAVSDLDIATEFFERVFGFELISSRVASHGYLGKLVGSPGITAKINMLRIDENNLLEILEWAPISSGGPRQSFRVKINEYAAQHLCLYTNDAELVFSKLKSEEVEFISDAPIVVEDGPNKGAKVFFVKAFGFLYIEIFQR